MMNRIVVVTGATGSLGPAVVRAFQDSGDRVLTVARSAGDFRADLTDSQQATGLVQSIVAEHGRIDTLVHVMGGFAGGSPVQDTDDSTWHGMMSINLHAAFYVFRAVLPHMRQAAKGRIVAVGSRAGVLPAAGLSAYSVSKAGLHALVQTIALELRGTRITANAVLPSAIGTAAGQVPAGSIARVIVWLASDAAADVNGALVPVYGGA